MEHLTKEQAIAFYEGEMWKPMSMRERALFQMEQDKLCMPFGEFHKAVEEALGRPVWTHEFGLNREGLLKELSGEAPAPTFEEIMGQLTATGKPVIVVQT